MRLLVTIVTGLVLFSIYCKKPQESPITKCRPVTQYSVNDITPIDTAKYVYENDKLVRINYTYTYQVIEYSVLGSLKVSRIIYWERTDTEPYRSMTIYYDGDGNLSKTVETIRNLPWFERTTLFSVEYGKIVRVIVTEKNMNGDVGVVEQHTFTYVGKNIATHVVEITPIAPEVILLEYDHTPNNFRKHGPEVMFLDPYLSMSWKYSLKLLPYVLSENNVIETTDVSAYGGAINYLLDQNNNLVEFTIGKRVIRYGYHCWQL